VKIKRRRVGKGLYGRESGESLIRRAWRCGCAVALFLIVGGFAWSSGGSVEEPLRVKALNGGAPVYSGSMDSAELLWDLDGRRYLIWIDGGQLKMKLSYDDGESFVDPPESIGRVLDRYRDVRELSVYPDIALEWSILFLGRTARNAGLYALRLEDGELSAEPAARDGANGLFAEGATEYEASMDEEEAVRAVFRRGDALYYTGVRDRLRSTFRATRLADDAPEAWIQETHADGRSGHLVVYAHRPGGGDRPTVTTHLARWDGLGRAERVLEGLDPNTEFRVRPAGWGLHLLARGPNGFDAVHVGENMEIVRRYETFSSDVRRVDLLPVADTFLILAEGEECLTIYTAASDGAAASAGGLSVGRIANVESVPPETWPLVGLTLDEEGVEWQFLIGVDAGGTRTWYRTSADLELIDRVASPLGAEVGRVMQLRTTPVPAIAEVRPCGSETELCIRTDDLMIREPAELWAPRVAVTVTAPGPAAVRHVDSAEPYKLFQTGGTVVVGETVTGRTAQMPGKLVDSFRKGARDGVVVLVEHRGGVRAYRVDGGDHE